MKAAGLLILFIVISAKTNFFSEDTVAISIRRTEKKIFFDFKKLTTTFPKKKSFVIDTAALKKSDWYSEAKKNIEANEYEINSDEQTVFSSSNPGQNLITSYSSDEFILKPAGKNNWDLRLQLEGIYSEKNKIYSPQKDAVTTIEKNKIRFNHNNEFIVEYVNTKEGVRQNFIIQQQPLSKPGTISLILKTNPGWLINKVHNKELHFAKWNGDHFNTKIIYNSLKIWDANNQELNSYFSVSKNEISIVVNTSHAVYPVTIDPLSSSPSTNLNGSAMNDYFGISVASAGDVNGDGYSDVIVGAYGVSSNKGKAYLYQGSATGLSTSPAITLNGASSGDLFGYCVASAGDVNGDGYSDVIVGAYGQSSSKGAAYVFHGSSSGLSSSPATTMTGANNGDDFGIIVASAGDINGDGYSDVIVGAPNNSSIKGVAYIFNGSSSGVSSSPVTTLNDIDNQVNDSFGFGVAGAGDVNGDGYSDVIISAPGVSSATGKAYIFTGSSAGISSSASPSTTLTGIASLDQFGHSVACAGDVNGDGYSDVIIGANGVASNKGAAYLFLGSGAGLSSSATVSLSGISTSDQFGQSVACAGDVNGDGYSDVIVGADVVGPSSTGAAYLFLGSSSGLSAILLQTISGINSSSSFGWSVASAGDINGDGYSDIIAGAPNTSTNTGAAYLYVGSAAGISSSGSTALNGNSTGDYFGVCVASAGDINGDGFSDVIIGAEKVSSNTGAAYLFLGSTTGLPSSPSTTLNGLAAGDYFGHSVACAGDVNGDGYSDVIIGAPQASSLKGAAYLFLGSSSGLSTSASITLTGSVNGDQLGVSAAGAGDVNGDGYGDVIIGAFGANSNKGVAYIYYGSPTGLSLSSYTTRSDINNVNNDAFGCSVAGAGDVNGDGYGDVIIGANGVSSYTGAAYLYLGGQLGLSSSPSTTLTGLASGDNFGVCVAASGDVNGDGYGDVIVGAHEVASFKGAAYIYLGSSTGLSSAIATTLSGFSAGDFFGVSVASAGDVNGDGYSDVIVGAYQVSSGVGAAYIYLGSSTGLSSSVSATLNGVAASGGFGSTVAGAGDINGDGFNDVIAGAPGVSSLKGAAYYYYGNSGNGLRNNLRLYNSDLVTPIQQSNMSDPNLFGAGLYAKSFIGRQKGKMVWETEWNGQAFSGNPITNSVTVTASQAAFSNLGISGTELKNQIAKRTGHKATYIRARIKYDLVTAITGQVFGPWHYPESFLRGKRDIGAVALPIKFISFTAVKQNNDALLKWATADEDNNVQFEVQRSNDGINFSTLKLINGNHQSLNDYQWVDNNTITGKNYYRIRAVSNGKEVFSQTRLLLFDKASLFTVDPDPVLSGSTLTISTSLRENSTARITLTNMAGQSVLSENLILSSTNRLIIPELAAGQYILMINSSKMNLFKKTIIVMKK